MTTLRPPIVTVVGPTATGKTALAVWLAQQLNGELVGADSVQIYRGFDIGSAKPTTQELHGVPHHLLGCVEPDAPIDAARFAALADAAIADIGRRNRLPIVVGGTGLWLRALWRGLVALPPVDEALREQLDADWAQVGPKAMHERLLQVDPLSGRSIHPNDRIRILRALEVHAQTGQPLGELRRHHALGSARYRMQMIHVDIPRAQLEPRVRARTADMLARGFADEVRQLITRHGSTLRALGSVGYREMSRHIMEGLSLEATEEAITRATLQYSKRQRTWFAGDPDTPPGRPPHILMQPDVVATLQRWLRNA